MGACLATWTDDWAGRVALDVMISQVLGFGEYIEEVYAAYEQHKLETMVSSLFSVVLVSFDIRMTCYCSFTVE